MLYLKEFVDLDKVTFYCLSGGNLPIVIYLCGKPIDFESMDSYFDELETVSRRSPLCGYCGSLEWLRGYLMDFCPDDIHIRAKTQDKYWRL
eukprot:UN04782